MKNLGKDDSGVLKVMRRRDYLGDAMGQFSLNILSTIVGQLTYFYTDKVGMAAGAVATMFLFCKILDAFSGLIIGDRIDHTKPGKEKYRPWLLKGGIPAGLALALIFTVPGTGQAGKMAYALVTNILLSTVCYTLISVPYSSLMIVRTKSQEERSIMGTCRAGAGYIAGMVIAIGIIPITNALGGTQNAWIKFGVMLAVLVVAGFLIAYFTGSEGAAEAAEDAEIVENEKFTSENPEDAVTNADSAKISEQNIGFGEAIKKLFKNKYWVIILIVGFLSSVLYGSMSGAATYYCRWIFGNDNLVGLFGAIGMIPTVLGFVLVNPMVRKWGITKTLMISFGAGIVANTLLIFTKDYFVCYALFGSITTFATIPMMCLTGVMTAMSIDYNEYKYGVRMVATSNSAAAFGGKVGSGVGASLIGWMLAFAGYDASLAEATQATKMAIYGFSFVVPLFMFIIMFVLVSRFDLEKKLPGMQEETDRKKSAAEGKELKEYKDL